MRLLREVLRKLKYKINFSGRSKEFKFSYYSNSNQNEDLTRLMNYYGSDKGGKNNQHNYSNYYSEIFFHKKKDIKNLLEIGLGTNDINLESNMGSHGIPLASLRAWRDYFRNANIYGADIDKKILNNENRIKTFYVDQTDPVSIFKLFQKIGDIKFDIILDDGLHNFEANICFFENSIGHLRNDGIYIIEDIYHKNQNKFLEYFKNKNYNYSLVNIYHKNNIKDNCLIIIRKNLQN